MTISDFNKASMDSIYTKDSTCAFPKTTLIINSTIAQTNAMVITGLSQNYFIYECLENLREIVSGIGPVQTWAPLKSLGRIVVVFDDLNRKDIEFGSCVKAARIYLNDLLLQDGDKLRVYSLEPVFEPKNGVYLEVKKAKKLWLISPPASPPSGWEATEEEPPNSTTFSHDLIRALEKLELSQDSSTLAQPHVLEKQPPIQIDLGNSRSDLPSILIEDCCASQTQASSVSIPRTPIPRN